MNERVFENPAATGSTTVLCGAANNVPQDEDLSAFVDRFVYRPGCVRNLSSKRELINRAVQKPSVSVRLTLDEIKTMQAAAANVPIPTNWSKTLSCQVARSEKVYIKGSAKATGEAHASVGDSQVYLNPFTTYCQIVCGRKTPGTAED